MWTVPSSMNLSYSLCRSKIQPSSKVQSTFGRVVLRVSSNSYYFKLQEREVYDTTVIRYVLDKGYRLSWWDVFRIWDNHMSSGVLVGLEFGQNILIYGLFLLSLANLLTSILRKVPTAAMGYPYLKHAFYLWISNDVAFGAAPILDLYIHPAMMDGVSKLTCL